MEKHQRSLPLCPGKPWRGDPVMDLPPSHVSVPALHRRQWRFLSKGLPDPNAAEDDDCERAPNSTKSASVHDQSCPPLLQHRGEGSHLTRRVEPSAHAVRPCLTRAHLSSPCATSPAHRRAQRPTSVALAASFTPYIRALYSVAARERPSARAISAGSNPDCAKSFMRRISSGLHGRLRREPGCGAVSVGHLQRIGTRIAQVLSSTSS